MADFFVLMHRDEGPLATALSAVEAGRHMARVASEDPDAMGSLWIEPFDVVEAAPPPVRFDR